MSRILLALAIVGCTGCTYRYRTSSFVAEESRQEPIASPEPLPPLPAGELPDPFCKEWDRAAVTTLETTTKLDEETNTLTTSATTTHRVPNKNCF